MFFCRIYIHMYIYCKGNNFCGFLFASLDEIATFKKGLLLKERICSKWSKFFQLRVDSLKKEA